MLFAYFAPETALPLASTAAASVGVVMMFGKSTLRFLKGLVWKKTAPSSALGLESISREESQG